MVNRRPPDMVNRRPPAIKKRAHNRQMHRNNFVSGTFTTIPPSADSEPIADVPSFAASQPINIDAVPASETINRDAVPASETINRDAVPASAASEHIANVPSLETSEPISAVPASYRNSFGNSFVQGNKFGVHTKNSKPNSTKRFRWKNDGGGPIGEARVFNEKSVSKGKNYEYYDIGKKTGNPIQTNTHNNNRMHNTVSNKNLLRFASKKLQGNKSKSIRTRVRNTFSNGLSRAKRGLSGMFGNKSTQQNTTKTNNPIITNSKQLGGKLKKKYKTKKRR